MPVKWTVEHEPRPSRHDGCGTEWDEINLNVGRLKKLLILVTDFMSFGLLLGCVG